MNATRMVYQMPLCLYPLEKKIERKKKGLVRSRKGERERKKRERAYKSSGKEKIHREYNEHGKRVVSVKPPLI